MTGRLEIRLSNVRMSAGNGNRATKTKGSSLTALSVIKYNIVVVKTDFLFLDHAVIIGMAWVNGNPKYKTYSNGYLLAHTVEIHMKESGIDYPMAFFLRKFSSVRITFRTTKLLFMKDWVAIDSIFNGSSFSIEKFYLLYNVDTRKYNVITNSKSPMANTYICNVCVTLYMTIRVNVIKVAHPEHL